MNRREFLATALAVPAAARQLAISAATWRTFEIITAIDLGLSEAKGPLRAWVPLPLARSADYQRNLGHTIGGNAARARVVRDPISAVEFVAAVWTDAAAPSLTVTMRVATAGHAVRLDRPSGAARPANLARYLKATALIPVDGIVRDTAVAITKGHRTELAKARAIYDWIVEHTVRDPEVKGCGLGDIRWMLETKSLAGKCADLNALFVGLARSVGLPARDLYGIRVAPSHRFASLGRAGGNITTAQHCRAEVFVDGYGWIPVDPADVRKLILEERPQSPLSDPYVIKARETLFGEWEMNWVAFNDAHDVALPGSSGKPLPFFMYPQAESAGTRHDPLDPARFRYDITAREA